MRMSLWFLLLIGEVLGPWCGGGVGWCVVCSLHVGCFARLCWSTSVSSVVVKTSALMEVLDWSVSGFLGPVVRIVILTNLVGLKTNTECNDGRKCLSGRPWMVWEERLLGKQGREGRGRKRNFAGTVRGCRVS